MMIIIIIIIKIIMIMVIINCKDYIHDDGCDGHNNDD